MTLPTNYELVTKFPYLIRKLKVKKEKAEQTAVVVCPKCKGKLFFVLNEPKPFPRKTKSGKKSSPYRYRYVCAECGSRVLYYERRASS